MHLSQLLYRIFNLSYRARKWYLRYLHALLSPEIALMKMVDNTLLLVRPRYDYVQREIYLYLGDYAYEGHLIRWINQNLHPGMVTVDVGAHVGYYLGPVCKSVGREGRPIFIEPFPEHFGLLQQNMVANGFAWATVLNLALSDESGEILLYPAIDSGRNSLAKNGITDVTPIRVPAITLDELCKELSLSNIDLLQLDVEGAEVLVIQGANECFKKRRVKTILCEWHPRQICDDFETNPLDLINQITQAGFAAFFLDPQTGQELAFDSARVDNYQHLVFRL